MGGDIRRYSTVLVKLIMAKLLSDLAEELIYG